MQASDLVRMCKKLNFVEITLQNFSECKIMGLGPKLCASTFHARGELSFSRKAFFQPQSLSRRLRVTFEWYSFPEHFVH